MRRHFLPGAPATVLCAISPLPAAGHRRGCTQHRDGDQLRHARRPGDIIDFVARRYSGKVLGADRGRRDGRATYRLKVLTEHGDVLALEVDAATGEILSILGCSR